MDVIKCYDISIEIEVISFLENYHQSKCLKEKNKTLKKMNYTADWCNWHEGEMLMELQYIFSYICYLLAKSRPNE